MTQDELLVLIHKKDEKAFTYLYDMYSKSLFSVINVLVKNREEAEDVLQEVFVKIWKNIDSYNESKGRFYTWILNIARNTSIDKLRSKNFNDSQKNLSSDNFVHLKYILLTPVRVSIYWYSLFFRFDKYNISTTNQNLFT